MCSIKLFIIAKLCFKFYLIYILYLLYALVGKKNSKKFIKIKKWLVDFWITGLVGVSVGWGEEACFTAFAVNSGIGLLFDSDVLRPFNLKLN